jgi:hypothetical protein
MPFGSRVTVQPTRLSSHPPAPLPLGGEGRSK